MRVPLSWLREYAPVTASGREVATALIRAGLEVEHVDEVGGDITGVVVGEVLEIEELTEFKKPIRYVRLDLGHDQRHVVCGASNFAVGDRVPVAVPGAVLPGDFKITARETYGRTSEGMICSARELGIGEDHTGILVLDHGAPLGQDAVETLGLRDEVLDIAVTPDRGYCLSVRGVAREAATAFDVAFTDPAAMPAPARALTGHPVTVEAVDGCPRYVARTVRDLSPLHPSPFWLRQRITLAGMRPISLAVDVTNYVLLDVGQPLHAFDLATLQGGIVVRRARDGERLTTLDGVDRALHPDDLVIADDSGAIAIAGVMGGATTEVTDTTRDVLVEAATFTAVGVGRTSRRHLLSSEASKRFERGVDPELAPVAAERAVALLTSLGGATADPTVTDVVSLPERPVITIAASAPAQRAGAPYTRDTVVHRLEQVGCDVTGDDPLVVTPPSWRPDLTEPVDLTEEVMRLEGYDEITPSLPPAPAGLGLTRRQRLVRRLGRALADAGYAEVVPYPFMSETVLDDLLVPADDERRRAPRIANPVSDAEPLLCTTLLPGLVSSLTRNVGRGLTDAALFQVSPVAIARENPAPAPRPGVDTRPDDATLDALDATLPRQPLHLGVVLTGLREPRGHWGSGRAASWEDAVEVVRLAARTLAAPVAVRQGTAAPWHPGRCAEFTVGGQTVGWAGELHPRVCAALDLPPRTCAAEIDLEPLLSSAVEHVAAPSLSPHPPAYVDVALAVPDATAAADVEDALRAGAGELLEDLRLFDVYTGLGEGLKSLAYQMRFRSPTGSLTSEEVNAMRDAAVAEAAARTGAVLRGA